MIKCVHAGGRINISKLDVLEQKIPSAVFFCLYRLKVTYEPASTFEKHGPEKVEVVRSLAKKI